MAQTAQDPTPQQDPSSEPRARPRWPRGAPGRVGKIRHGPRRTRVVIRRLGPLSILRFSLVFNFCVMLILYLAFAIIWVFVSAVGGVESLEKVLGWVFAVGTDQSGLPFRIDTGELFLWLFLIGCAAVITWSVVSVFVAFLYNLISDVVGGIEVTLAEKPERDPGE